jgi:hypothetical protein
MGCAPEVHAFDRHVGSEHQIFRAATLAEDGAIAPDAQYDARTALRTARLRMRLMRSISLSGSAASIGQHGV